MIIYLWIFFATGLPRDVCHGVLLYQRENIYYEDIFEEYNIDYVLLYKANIVATYLRHDENYIVEYEDDNFILFQRNII